MTNIWHKDIVPNKYCKGSMESRIGGRPENQDYFGCSDTAIGFLLVVCDGMGGGPGGALASSEATKTIINYVKSSSPDDPNKKDVLISAIQNANSHLRQLQLLNHEFVGMGTTCVLLLIDDKCAIAAHVGDSRIYQMRFKDKLWRSFDHSLVMEKTISDPSYTEEDARIDPSNNVITRALGINDEIKVDTKILPYEKGDRFALCTDGVWGVMPENKLVKLLNSFNNIDGTLEKTMISVQEIGLDEKNGYYDNFTLALIETTCNSKLKEEMTHKTRLTLRILMVICTISLIANVFFWSSFRDGKDNHVPLSSDSSYSNFVEKTKIDISCRDSIIDSLQDTIIELRKRNRELRHLHQSEKFENDDTCFIGISTFYRPYVTNSLYYNWKLIIETPNIYENSKNRQK